MKRLNVVRIVGWIQLGLSMLLAITTVLVYLSYRSSLGDMSHSLAESVLSVSDVITKVAKTIEIRQILIDDTAELLVASRKLVADAKTSAETQRDLLPRYADALRAASVLATDIGNTLVGTGDRMMFKVPTGFHMEGMKPVLDWTKPLEISAQSLRTHGQEFKKLNGNLIAVAGSIDNDAQKVNSGFIEVSQKTLRMIDDLAKATKTLKSQDLPNAIAALKATAGNLRQASTEANGVERFVVSLLLAGLVLAVLFAFNSVGVLLIVDSLSKGSAKPSPSVQAV